MRRKKKRCERIIQYLQKDKLIQGSDDEQTRKQFNEKTERLRLGTDDINDDNEIRLTDEHYNKLLEHVNQLNEQEYFIIKTMNYNETFTDYYNYLKTYDLTDRDIRDIYETATKVLTQLRKEK